MELTTQEAIDLFSDLLDDREPITIGYLHYLPSEVLKAIDPIAYEQGLLDYIDELLAEGYKVEGF